MSTREVSVEVNRLLQIPQSLIKAELEGLYGTNVLQDMGNIISLYDLYDRGAGFTKDETDFTPADLRSKAAANLINKEARFMFSKTPDFYIDVAPGDSKESRKLAKDSSSVYQTLVDRVLEANMFSSSLIRAAKDCFIGKRVALMFNINEDSGIQISFLPSLEFVYDVDPSDSNRITKIIAFYGLNDLEAKSDQRIYKKKYWLENGVCWYSEEVYNGMGQVQEVIQDATPTKFSFIPAWVIVNDGLTGDILGTSEVSSLVELEGWYNRLSSADIDAERKGMNPVRYTVDASPDTTKGLKSSPGAFWDLASDQNQAADHQAQVGTLESSMSYSSALSTTLDRIKNMMHEQTSVPDVSPASMKGIVSSGKTLKAIYWDLIVRCDEKMLVWRPALKFLAKCIIEGVRLYPKAGSLYISEPLPTAEYDIRVDNQYSLPEDEQEEKNTDLAEVNAQTMSKKSYMKKWRNLTDDEADEELRQIALERQLLEDSFSEPPMAPGEDEEETASESNLGDEGQIDEVIEE